MARLILSFLLFFACIIMKAQLPVLKLEGNFGYDYQQGTISLTERDQTITRSAKIKWRGGTTNTDDKHKRNYKIKLDEDISLLGLRSDNNWILDAGQADIFRLRNRIATEIWNDMAQKPYYYSQEPKVLTGVRGKVIEVYLNDEYVGIYCLTEAMDRKQLKLKKFNAKTGEIHGGLWKAVDWQNSKMDKVIPYDNSKEIWGSFEVKYPELDDLETTDYSTLYNAINFIVTSSDEEFKNSIHEYFDIPVLIDYYIFIHALNACDNTGKNIYWAVYDKEKDKKLTLAVWDLDCTAGQKWVEKHVKNASHPETEMKDINYLYTRLKELDVDNFNEKINKRYQELRNSYLSTENLLSRYEYYYQLLKQCGAAKREEERWNRDSDIDGNILNFESELSYIKNWIIIHMNFLDKNVFFTQTDIQTIKNTNDDNHTIYSLQGLQLKSPVKGINIIKNKKIIVK